MSLRNERCRAEKTRSSSVVTRSEVNDRLRAGFDLVEVGGPRAGTEVLPAAVADDRDDDPFVQLRSATHRGRHDRAGGDTGEHADLGESARPLDRFAWADDHASIEQFVPVVVDEHRRDEALVDVLQPVHHLTGRWLDGPELNVRILLLEEVADSHQACRPFRGRR